MFRKTTPRATAIRCDPRAGGYGYLFTGTGPSRSGPARGVLDFFSVGSVHGVEATPRWPWPRHKEQRGISEADMVFRSSRIHSGSLKLTVREGNQLVIPSRPEEGRVGLPVPVSAGCGGSGPSRFPQDGPEAEGRRTSLPWGAWETRS